MLQIRVFDAKSDDLSSVPGTVAKILSVRHGRCPALPSSPLWVLNDKSRYNFVKLQFRKPEFIWVYLLGKGRGILY